MVLTLEKQDTYQALVDEVDKAILPRRDSHFPDVTRNLLAEIDSSHHSKNPVMKEASHEASQHLLDYLIMVLESPGFCLEETQTRVDICPSKQESIHEFIRKAYEKRQLH